MSKHQDIDGRPTAEVVPLPIAANASEPQPLPEPAVAARPTVNVPFSATDLMASRDVIFSESLGEQMMETLALSPEMGEAAVARRATAALGAIREIGPKNGAEAMAAANMVAAHNAGLALLAR